MTGNNNSMFFIRSIPRGLQIICDYIFSHTIFSCGVNELTDCEVVDCLSVQVKDIYGIIINPITFYTIWNCKADSTIWTSVYSEGGKGGGGGGGMGHVSQREKKLFHNSRVLKKQFHISLKTRF